MQIELTAADGHRLAAWRAGRDDAPRSLVMVQEIFGVNRHMRRLADHVAAMGYAVIVPALFDRVERGVELGYAAEDVKRGRELRARVPDAGVLADVEAAAAALPPDAARGIIGYCWGGTVAWWGATRSDSFLAAVGYYGGGVAATADAPARCPVQLHFGETDASIPMADVDAFRAAQTPPTGAAVEVFTYPGAGHGFACEDRGSFEPAATATAEERAFAFLAHHLAPAGFAPGREPL